MQGSEGRGIVKSYANTSNECLDMLPEGWDKVVGGSATASTARIGARRLAGHMVVRTLPGTRIVEEHGNDLVHIVGSAGHARGLQSTTDDVGTTAPQLGQDLSVSIAAQICTVQSADVPRETSHLWKHRRAFHVEWYTDITLSVAYL